MPHHVRRMPKMQRQAQHRHVVAIAGEYGFGQRQKLLLFEVSMWRERSAAACSAGSSAKACSCDRMHRWQCEEPASGASTFIKRAQHDGP